MRRHLVLLCALFAGAAGCDTTCGPGTKRVQQDDGAGVCVPVDQPAAATTCDVDAGDVEISAGRCVSRVACDPATATFDAVSGLCMGNGVASQSACKPCATPTPGDICVSGDVYDFATGMKVMPGGRPLRIAIYDPASFLTDPNATPLAETASTTNGCFTLSLHTPPTGLVAIGVADPAGGPGALPPLLTGGTGGQVVSGQSYRIDGYLVQKSLVAGWSQGGLDYVGKGAFVGCYYDEPVPPSTQIRFVETTPAANVSLRVDGVTPPGLAYLAVDRSRAPGLSATGALGCGVAVGDGTVHTITGTGGGVDKWETHVGAALSGVVFVDRMHRCDPSQPGPTCP